MQMLKSSKQRSEYRRRIRKNYYFEQLKPKLREIFDYVDRTGTSTISINEIKEALQLLNVDQTIQKLENFDEILSSSKDSLTKSDITYEDFINLYFYFLDFMDIQQNLKDCPVLDFLDPWLFAYANDNKIINKNLSLKVFDESVVFRKKIELKYNLNWQQNIRILKSIEDECIATYPDSPYLQSFLSYSYSLRDCWVWVGKCHEFKRTSSDFTQGLRTVLVNLSGNSGAPSMHAEKIVMGQYIVWSNYERQEALNLLGWSYIEYFPKTSSPKLNDIIRGFEEEKDYSRAAAICVFHFDFARAFQCLANIQTNNNEVSFLKSILQLLKDMADEPIPR